MERKSITSERSKEGSNPGRSRPSGKKERDSKDLEQAKKEDVSMRELTRQQKDAIKYWFKANTRKGLPTEHPSYPSFDDMSGDTYEKIEEMHPTEIHYQNVKHYIDELREQAYENEKRIAYG